MEEQNKIIGQFDKKKNPFKVPDNYFDDFSAQLEKKLATTPVAPAPVIKKSFFKAHIQPLLYVAAVVTLLTGISYVAVQPLLQDVHDEKATNQSATLAHNKSQIERASINTKASYTNDNNYIDLSEDDYYDLLAEYDSDEMYELLSMN
jgi:hypothetical protein